MAFQKKHLLMIFCGVIRNSRMSGEIFDVFARKKGVDWRVGVGVPATMK